MKPRVPTPAGVGFTAKAAQARHWKLAIHRCAQVPMMNKRTGEVDFVLLVYGRSARELMTVPNEVVDSLSRRYPNHISSPFALSDAPPPFPQQED